MSDSIASSSAVASASAKPASTSRLGLSRASSLMAFSRWPCRTSHRGDSGTHQSRPGRSRQLLTWCERYADQHDRRRYELYSGGNLWGHERSSAARSHTHHPALVRGLGGICSAHTGAPDPAEHIEEQQAAREESPDVHRADFRIVVGNGVFDHSDSEIGECATDSEGNPFVGSYCECVSRDSELDISADSRSITMAHDLYNADDINCHLESDAFQNRFKNHRSDKFSDKGYYGGQLDSANGLQ